VRSQALKAIELSQKRADEIKTVLIEKQHVDAKRTRCRRPRLGRAGGSDSAQNRRVEVQWFTLEYASDQVNRYGPALAGRAA
jgi:flagellar motor protein MotB